MQSKYHMSQVVRYNYEWFHSGDEHY
uniref:Uncharacterized protein n=1 Tax=Lepeophtheirus salmonis TaxID=72036 RepID=A0A0K2T2U5_LEPSM